MTNLSPAAQTVEDSYFNADGFGYRNGLAAALRAAADRVAPESTEPNRSTNEQPERDVVFIGTWHIWNTQRKVRSDLLAIATELETSSL